eukprot:CAMPEP_0177164908 /NCGR_PEP_ID=MMETSP0367-20130122/7206_1 /TAXON_ID=447022 ORGANISM="Scrippsiella hangoei-like, Strain SHHI-4" /NCGR_SAMPLE_ID=MMETSP0367 /ASSEMBLY_ACC=CAM_ASM_000362 /LENGTH=86 /DNA_ID=CAMNT_0018610851 /DNA_START=769 /DNA_END=1029 /DNA_ORIENTATION=-
MSTSNLGDDDALSSAGLRTGVGGNLLLSAGFCEELFGVAGRSFFERRKSAFIVPPSDELVFGAVLMLAAAELGVLKLSSSIDLKLS